jgi:hypothetical protein
LALHHTLISINRHRPGARSRARHRAYFPTSGKSEIGTDTVKMLD